MQELEIIYELQRLIYLYSPAQIAVWLGLADPRPIHQWILRKKIPRTKLVKVEELLKKRGDYAKRIIRRSKRAKEGTV